MDVSDLVRAELHERFAPQDFAAALALLAATELPMLTTDELARTRDRVQLAAIKVAARELGQLADALALGARDWRDLLVSAGLDRADWPEVLRECGMRVP